MKERYLFFDVLQFFLGLFKRTLNPAVISIEFCPEVRTSVRAVCSGSMVPYHSMDPEHPDFIGVLLLLKEQITIVPD